MAAISQTIFSDAFSQMKHFVFCLKIHCSPKGPIDNNIGLDNGLVSKRQQAIIWSNADLIHWRIYVAQGGMS